MSNISLLRTLAYVAYGEWAREVYLSKWRWELWMMAEFCLSIIVLMVMGGARRRLRCNRDV
jgi:hypothetical protein